MTKEIWKDIEGYEGYYQISTLGRVKSIERKVDMDFTNMNNTLNGIGKYSVKEKILKPSIKKYSGVCLLKNGKRYWPTIHRLVGLAFIPNQFNKPQINHIDGNKHNNCINNLEWVTISENAKHAYYTLNRKSNLINWNKK